MTVQDIRSAVVGEKIVNLEVLPYEVILTLANGERLILQACCEYDYCEGFVNNLCMELTGTGEVVL